jgi:hypothetical protein
MIVISYGGNTGHISHAGTFLTLMAGDAESPQMANVLIR